MRALRKVHAAIFNPTGDIRGEARLVERAFDIGLSALTEVVALLGQNMVAMCRSVFPVQQPKP